MPRNSVGNYSPPAGTVPLPNTLGDATKVASYLADLGAEITTSVATDGRTPMTGPLTLSGNATAALHAVALQQIQTGGAVQPGGLSANGPYWDPVTGYTAVSAGLKAVTSGSVEIVAQSTGTGFSKFQLTNTARKWALLLYDTGQFAIQDNTINTDRIFINTTGNVGIGTSSPGAKLDVSGNIRSASVTGAATLYPSSTLNKTGFIAFEDQSGTRCGYLGFSDTGSITFDTDNTSRAFFIKVGNITRATVNSTGIGADISQCSNAGPPVAAIPLNGVGMPIVRLSGNYVVGNVYSNNGATPLPAGSWRCESVDGVNYSGGITVNAALLKRVS